MKTKVLKHLTLNPIHKPQAHMRESPPGLPTLDKAPLLSACGSRGSGKSMTMTNLLRLYQDYPQKDGKKTWDRVFVISPTFEENMHYWDFLKIDEDDAYLNPAISSVNNVVAKIEEDIELYKEYLEKKEQAIIILKKLMKVGMEALSERELLLLYSINFDIKNVKWKYDREVPPCFCLIIDDCSHSKIFSNSGTNKFSNLALRNRHKNTTIAMMVQSYKTGVPKFLRQGNLSCLMLWRIYDQKLIDDIYQEVSNDLTIDEWKKLFEYATDGEDGHSHLTIFFDMPKNEGKYRKNLNEIISIDDVKNIPTDD
jgi:hypothetical protein